MTLNSVTDSHYPSLKGVVEKYPETDTLVSLFARAVKNYGSNIALSSNDVFMTYSSLYNESGKIANALTDAGLVKGDSVGLYMQRSLETVVSILGVLRAGGVYVPIDPDHPAERNRYILENSNCNYVLVKDDPTSANSNSSIALDNVKLLNLQSIFSEADSSFIDVSVSPDDLAYIIYTSGSTGKPKGALLAHRGVVNLYNTMTNFLNLTPSDVILQFCTYSFDPSVVDTFEALLNGAHLVLLTKEEQLTPELLMHRLAASQVTHIGGFPTSVFNRIAEIMTPDLYSKWDTVKSILIGGEALLSDHVRKFQDKLGTSVSILNAYGPTECTVISSIFRVEGYWDNPSITVPIGKPIGNYNLYVVKEDGSLANVGEEGELYVETIALFKGYINEKAKTDEVLIRNPFASDTNTLCYKTGDIVKILDNGNLEFQHRKDGQLKLRGFRIEIGEIENALSKHPALLDASVIAIKDNGVVKHLSCFYSEKSPTSVAEIKQHLKTYVPDYMIPSYFYCLPEIPLAPTRKVDRAKLYLMDNPEMAEMDEPFEAPVGSLEQMLASIWSETLSIPKVGRSVSFFNIGGDSLAVMGVLSYLKLDYPNLTMNDLYTHKTVRDLAVHIQGLEFRQAQPSMELEPTLEHINDLKELPILPKVEATNMVDGLGSDILLTGVTGYLGSHILAELLQSTNATIHVLVRPKLGENGISRVWETLDFYFGQDFFLAYTMRINVIEGNLVGPHLGLTSYNFTILASKVTSIIHAGADVRHFGDESTFQETNVLGTKTLLSLLDHNPRICFHFVSTLSIPEDMAIVGVLEDVTDSVSDFYNVKLPNFYTNSKLMAEKEVVEAIKRGLSCSIYRSGNLSCHSETGRFQKNINENYFYRMLKAFMLLGKAPIMGSHFDITPVDFASTFMVSLMKRISFGEVYHICNPQQDEYEALFAQLNRSGYPIELMPIKEFERWVLTEGNAVSKEGVQLAMGLLDGDGVNSSTYRCSSTDSFAKADGVFSLPAFDVLMNRLLAHAIERDYFSPPNTKERNLIKQ